VAASTFAAGYGLPRTGLCPYRSNMGGKMNKSELVKRFSEHGQIGDEAASELVDLFFGAIKQALIDGERVEIRGFGSFELRQYDGYTGRNPKSGSVVAVKPKKLPFFKTGKRLKDYINRDG
jgi:integration host factor subunit beta